MGAIVNLEYDVDLRTISISDGGNVAVQSNNAVNNAELEVAHAKLREKVASIIKRGGIPFVVGGGNDQSCPNALGLIDALEATNLAGPVGVVNIDAHFDVRPRKEGKVHSGSPFRELMEDPKWNAHSGYFTEFAAQGSQTSAEHAAYIKSKARTRIVYLNEIRKSTAVEKFKEVLNNLGEHIFVSFDLDAVSSADAPGVSAPANVGLSAQEAVDICFAAGADRRVKLFDLSEFNPAIDSYRTGRLVSLMFYNFLLGYATRKKNN